MTFGLKTYLAEESKRYDVVLVKKKIYLKARGDGFEWVLKNTGFGAPEDTLWPDQVLVGMRVERGRLRYISRVNRKTGEVSKKSAGDYADFNPSEFDELVKLGALKGLA